MLLSLNGPRATEIDQSGRTLSLHVALRIEAARNVAGEADRRGHHIDPDEAGGADRYRWQQHVECEPGQRDVDRRDHDLQWCEDRTGGRSEEHTSELQSLMRSSSAVFCLKNKTRTAPTTTTKPYHINH